MRYRRNADDAARRSSRRYDANRSITDKVRAGMAGQITLDELMAAHPDVLDSLPSDYADAVRGASAGIGPGTLRIPVVMHDQLEIGAPPVEAVLFVTGGLHAGQIYLEVHDKDTLPEGEAWPIVALLEYAEGEIRILPYNRADPEGQPFNVVAVYPEARPMPGYGADL